MDREVDNVKAGLIEEIAYHLEEIDNLANGSQEQQRMVDDLTKLVDSLNKLNQTEYEKLDKDGRRKIDTMKNQALYELEQKKSELSWQRVTFEMAKIMIPTIISIGAYEHFQRRILEFEETGRITSTAGRELHLPRFFK